MTILILTNLHGSDPCTCDCPLWGSLLASSPEIELFTTRNPPRQSLPVCTRGALETQLIFTQAEAVPSPHLFSSDGSTFCGIVNCIGASLKVL